MSKSHALLKSARTIHLYFGVFITPALIFFAFTGAIQTFSLHETTRGSSYKPPAILVELGQLHKKQTLAVPQRKPQAPEAKPAEPRPVVAPAFDPSAHGDFTNQQKHDRMSNQSDTAKPTPAPAATPAPSTPAPPPAAPQKQKNLLPMKIFFLLVSIGLFTSTLTGLYMSYKFIRNKTLVTLTLLAGIAVPVLLLLV